MGGERKLAANGFCDAVEKKKKDMIHRAKVKKAYARIKAQEHGDDPQPRAEAHSNSESEAEASGDEEPTTTTEAATAEPPEKPTEPPKKTEPTEPRDSPELDPQMHPARQSNLRKRPGYFDRALKESAKRKAQREAREAEFQRRREERERRVRERQRFRKVSARAREVGPDGRRKLGRESEVLLEKVKRMVGQS